MLPSSLIYIALILPLTTTVWQFPTAAATSRLSVRDLVAAIPTFDKRHGLTQASRAWRHGLGHSFIVTNATTVVCAALSASRDNINFRETYSHFPDRPPSGTFGLTHDMGTWTIRSAIAPFLAHAHMVKTSHTYKWMLYGDDDTVYFMPNVMKLLERLDHTVPMALTDNLWCGGAEGLRVR